jgi:NADH dehydrogenase
MTIPRALFVTGGAGFVGRRLLAELRATGRPIVALDRSGSLAEPAAEIGVRVVRGSLLEPETYRDALRSCETVIHLAAATGKASAHDHFLINTRGTEILLEACQQAGVANFLFVSSIAATFPDLRGYHYAQAKLQAEGAVLRSKLRPAILRPTVILGPGAPLLRPLEKLALLPLIVLPGAGRARVQPIHVDDVVRAIVTVVRDDLFDGATYEIGGPAVVSMEELLRRVRRARTGRDARVLRVPLGLLRAPLRLAEAAGLGRLLPVSAGQLSSFEWDGVATDNRVQTMLRGGLLDLGLMLGAGTGQAAPDALDAECRVFTDHLLGCEPGAYVTAKYRAAHAAVPALSEYGRSDEALIAFARRGPIRAKLADAYAAVFAPRSALRKKLVMLLAILETSQSTYPQVDAAIGGSRAATLVRLVASGAGAVGALALGTMVLLPRRVMTRSRRSS